MCFQYKPAFLLGEQIRQEKMTYRESRVEPALHIAILQAPAGNFLSGRAPQSFNSNYFIPSERYPASANTKLQINLYTNRGQQNRTERRQAR